MPSLTQLEYLLAVDKHRHFGKAAESCFVTQPTLSMQIQKLEEELGVIIFDRSKKPVLPTEVGRSILDQARKTLAEFNKISVITKQNLNELSGQMKLAVIPTLSTYVLPLFLKEFSELYPQVKLDIDEMQTSQIIESLENDQIDVGLAATPLGINGIEERPLFYEPFFLLAPAGHALAEKAQIDEDDLDASELWLLKQGHCFRDQMAKLCSLKSKQSVFKNVNFESGNLETIKELVAKNGGYTLLPYLATLNKIPKGTVLRPFAKPVPVREVSAVFSRTQLKKPLIEALRKVIQKNLPSGVETSKSKGLQVLKI
jgi:LysR family transcriptional regulator, hydrogen peroxide-inducible genes activator